MNLHALTTPSGHLVIAAFDHRSSLAAFLNPQDPQAVPAACLVAVKRLFIESFSGLVSAMLIDPIYGLDYGLDLDKEVPAGTGLLFALEASSYTDTDQNQPTQLLPHWGVADIKARHAAAKLLLYYHPHAPAAPVQFDLVKQISRQCRRLKVIFLLEPILHGLGQFSQKDKLSLTLKMIDQFCPLVDILKLEFPLNLPQSSQPEWVKASQAISRHATVPWVLLSRGMAYSHFKLLTQVACTHGASGIAVGRAVWQEIGDLATRSPSDQESLAAIKTFLQTTGRTRLKALAALVVAHAKPVTAFHP
ncbi:hypothetical protein A2W24_00280 [Microgenomates group bacterium RBG_16_45_19]|nr:MAG: hypothetical protein A2W24_00280 [Microgenomates group bacterium RBG_16_45_19]